MKSKNVWFVTGASKGLGLVLTKKLLSEGYKVAATTRNSEALIKEVGPQNENFLPLVVDLGNEQSVSNAVEATLKHFKTIDVVVNNAGYGQMGTLEELSDAEARKNFDVNVFGLLNVVRQTMPVLRAKKSGHVFNISSIGGYDAGYAGWAIYCSTKFAVSGITEGLAAEAKAFGIDVTLVYPGYFRTNFLDKDSVALPANPIAAYEDARKSQAMHTENINGNQPGDPEKAVEALIQISKAENPPLHLFLGEDAFNGAYAKQEQVKADMERFKAISVSTNFDAVAAS